MGRRARRVWRYWLARYRVSRRISPLYGDGIHDDAPGLQAMLDTGKWPPPPGTYIMTTALEVRGD